MSEANKDLARRFYDTVNKGNLNEVDALIADNFVDHEEIPGIPPDKAGVVQFLTMMREAFPDFRMNVQEILTEGDKVVVRGSMTGTHKGDFMGIPATNQAVDVPMIDIVRVEDGKAAEHWGVMDSGLMMQQLGLVDAPGGGDSPGLEVQE